MQYLLENNNPVDEAQDVEEVVSLALCVRIVVVGRI